MEKHLKKKVQPISKEEFIKVLKKISKKSGARAKSLKNQNIAKKS